MPKLTFDLKNFNSRKIKSIQIYQNVSVSCRSFSRLKETYGLKGQKYIILSRFIFLCNVKHNA